MRVVERMLSYQRPYDSQCNLQVQRVKPGSGTPGSKDWMMSEVSLVTFFGVDLQRAKGLGMG